MISEREAAKYPFTRQTLALVESLDVKVDDLAAPHYAPVLDRGEQRVSEAIVDGAVGDGLPDDMAELLSFPVAVMLVTAVGDRFLDRRYALAEAERVNRLLRNEGEDLISEMAKTEFGWDIRTMRVMVDGQPYGFDLHFSDYLRNAAAFHEDKWKLVNRIVGGGYVQVTKMEATRLIQVEVEELIRDRVSKHVKLSLPEEIQARVDRIAKLFEANRVRITGEEMPSEVVTEAFPPCIRHAFEGLMAGRRVSHMERFGLTSFLVNTGMDLEAIVKLYVSVTDFDEQLTRYQIEHIAGLRGSRTRYTPPTCATLRTHGVCHNPDTLCKRVRHPLSYYRLRVRELGRDEGDGKPVQK